MKTVLSALISASVLFTTSVASVAEPEKTVTIIDLASKYCAAEWTGVIELDPRLPRLIFENEPIVVDPDIDTATTQAFLKYLAVGNAILLYLQSFPELSDETKQTPEFLELAKAELDLITCLIPTESERALVEDLAKTTTKAFGLYDVQRILDVIDGFVECSQIIQASEAFFNAESFPVDFQAIAEVYMIKFDCS